MAVRASGMRVSIRSRFRTSAWRGYCEQFPGRFRAVAHAEGTTISLNPSSLAATAVCLTQPSVVIPARTTRSIAWVAKDQCQPRRVERRGPWLDDEALPGTGNQRVDAPPAGAGPRAVDDTPRVAVEHARGTVRVDAGFGPVS